MMRERRFSRLGYDTFEVDLDRLAAAASRAETSISSISVSGHHSEVFAVMADGTLRHRWHVDHWSEWTHMPLPPGRRAVQVSAGSRDGRVDLFVLSADGELLRRWWGPNDGWSGWRTWGKGFRGPIALTSRAEEHLEVWVRFHDKLVHRWQVGGEWSSWHSFA